MKDLKEKICPSIRADCRYGYGDNVCDNCNKILDEYISEHDKQVRAEAIDELETELIDIILGNEEFTDWQKQEISFCLECAIEQLKEKNK